MRCICRRASSAAVTRPKPSTSPSRSTSRRSRSTRVTPRRGSGLAGELANQAASACVHATEGVRLAREASAKALAIDPDYAPAHDNLGWIAMSFEATWRRGAALEHALALEPANTTSRQCRRPGLESDRLDEAIALDEDVVRRDPINLSAHANLGVYYLPAGRLDEAIATFRTVLRLAPGWRRAILRSGGAAAEGRAAGSACRDAEGTERGLAPARPDDGLPRARSQGRFRCRAGRDDREVRADAAYNIAYVLRLPQRGAIGPSSGSTRR